MPTVLGVDEVGRGPIAGPLVVGAVILPEEEQPWFSDLKDSKKLSRTKRERLNYLILATSTVGLGWISAEEIDELGMNEALCRAAYLAVKEAKTFRIPFSQIIIDGTQNFLAGTPLAGYANTLIKADDKIREVSAASIVAKVARDNYMIKLSRQYPEYDFEHNVGYGTPKHQKAIEKYGLTPEHRRSFEPCKSLAKKTSHTAKTSHTTKIGRIAEAATANYLKTKGHRLVARNYKTSLYEIDLITIKDDCIYFTEVKYRQNNYRGTGAEYITKTKLDQMHFAARCYLKSKFPKYEDYQPLLAVASVTGNLKNLKTSDINWFPLTI